MPEYRTPEENRAHDEQEARIRRVLDQALTDGASLIMAIEQGQDKAVVEMWTDRLWNGLRDGLVDGREPRPDCPNLRPEEDRLAAIVQLLTPRIRARAAAIMRGVCDA